MISIIDSTLLGVKWEGKAMHVKLVRLVLFKGPTKIILTVKAVYYTVVVHNFDLQKKNYLKQQQ